MAASFKLASLLLKQLSKPLANSLKHRARESERFEKFCISLAQTYNTFDIILKQRVLDYSSGPVKPLSEARAVELGANFLSEIIIFSTAALTILAETYRSSKSQSQSKIEVRTDIGNLEASVADHEKEIKLLATRINELNEKLDVWNQKGESSRTVETQTV